MSAPTTAAFWQSPSGRIHVRRECTGAGPPNRCKRVHLTEDEFNAAARCPCASRWRGPDRYVVRSRPDPAWPDRKRWYVYDLVACWADTRSFGARGLADVEADRRNAKHRAVRGPWRGDAR